MLERFNMDNAKLMSIAMTNHFRSSIDQRLKIDDAEQDMSLVTCQCSGVIEVFYGLYKIRFGTSN